ncbi:hypothetical protein BAUCODRAFT_25178 [Baudoinia panamericana UAMH 10762]|uniref:Chromatin modification-related protein EAF6 n=1 Tax=Baudoinia panamericana (strain UAMH 10762) TaxID=717646 RepID=M2LLB5_BAUPA|nr:uncharacterized protein BAUCODRAFT_25178 [Baudoinia panamericana UAMH 10762]EMC95057.1 hypothetical protein BAUCODRAFT_25178 [Baudoinia panamericana UAMH 10762]
MAENVPPGSSATAAATSDQPGRPYYESLRATLRQTLEKKRKLDESLAGIEDQIFKAEGAYLEETANSGNIVRGFDGWVKGVQVGGGRGADDRRRGRVREEDRVFSRSSVSWMRAQEGPDSGTPSHAATPTASLAPSLSTRANDAASSASATVKAPNKKKRPTEKDEEDETKSAKRGKITYARN